MENAGNQSDVTGIMRVCVCLCNWEVIIAPDVQRHHWEAFLTVLCQSHYS